MLLIIELILGGFVVAGTHGMLQFSGDNMTTDFVSFYAAGSLADAGTPALAYHPAELFRAEQQARTPGIEYNYFYYPPVFLLISGALARLPYLPAFFVFEGVTLCLYLVVITRITGEVSWQALAAIAAFPVVFWNFGWGQNGFLSAALIGAGTLLVDRRPVLAGLLFGAVCYKPHFGLLIPIALAAGRHWRSFAAAAVWVVGLVALSLLLFGASTWYDYIAAAVASPATYMSGKVKFSAFVTPFGATLLLSNSAPAAYVVQAIATAAAIAVVAVAWYRDLALPLRAATLIAATLIAVPLALVYDLLLAAVAVAWLYRSESGLLPTERLVVAGSYLLSLVPDQIGDILRVPAGPCVAMAILIIAARRVFMEGRTAPVIGLSLPSGSR